MGESLPTDPVWGWRGAASGIRQRMKHILETGECSDVEFAVGHQYGMDQVAFFQVHKFVLRVSSDVFETMFYGGIPQAAEEIIELPDILPQAFGLLLQYVYMDVIGDLDLENVMPTLYCAKKYGLPGLIDICTQYAVKNVDKDSCLAVLEAAQVLDAGDIVMKCLTVVDTHCSDLLPSQEFLQIKNETLQLIFSRDTLIANEREIYKAAERWAVNACQTNNLKPTVANCREVLGPALFAIRFPLMDDGQLADGPITNCLLLNEEVQKISQFKRATKKPNIVFSATPRSSNIVFCDRQWIVMGERPTIMDSMAAGNVKLDEAGHVHLRMSKDKTVWKGAGIQSAEALGFGRYEFHVQGLEQLGSGTGFAVYSQGRRELGVGVSVVGCLSQYNASSLSQITFAVRRWSRFEPFDRDRALCDKVTVKEGHTMYSYQRKAASVSFSSERYDEDNDIRGDANSWSYKSKSNISEEACPVFFCLSCLPDTGFADNKDVEIVLHDFRFYPDER